MNRIAALTLASAAVLFAACQNSKPAQQAAPTPPPPPVAAAPAMPTPPSLATPPSTVPGSGSRTVAEAFGAAKHLKLEVRTLKEGKADIATKTLDDQIPAVIAALGADHRSTPAMPRCMTPVTFSFSDANNASLGSVGFCDTGTPAAVMAEPGRIDFADKTMGGFQAADPSALAKFLP